MSSTRSTLFVCAHSIMSDSLSLPKPWDFFRLDTGVSCPHPVSRWPVVAQINKESPAVGKMSSILGIWKGNGNPISLRKS